MQQRSAAIAIALAGLCTFSAAALAEPAVSSPEDLRQRAILEADQLFGDMTERMILLAVTASEAAAEEVTREDTGGKTSTTHPDEEEGEE